MHVRREPLRCPTCGAPAANAQRGAANGEPRRRNCEPIKERPDADRLSLFGDAFGAPDGSTYLDVPYDEKDTAKRLGARFAHDSKRWYVPPGVNPANFGQWLEKPPIVELTGEDRSFGGNLLFIDLIPATSWCNNARILVSESDWLRLRRYVHQRVGNKCEICGAQDPLEAHERWEYDEQRALQTLRRLIALCGACHEATHFGLAAKRGRLKDAAAHIRHMRRWSKNEFAQHRRDAISLCSRRNKIDWCIDASILASAVPLDLDGARAKVQRKRGQLVGNEQRIDLDANWLSNPLGNSPEGAKRDPEWVTWTNIRDYERCPYGFWLMDTGVVKREANEDGARRGVYEYFPDREGEYVVTLSRAERSGMPFLCIPVAGDFSKAGSSIQTFGEKPVRTVIRSAEVEMLRGWGWTVEVERGRVYAGSTVENVQRKLAGRPDDIDLKTHAPHVEKNHSQTFDEKPVATALDKYKLAFCWLLLEPFRTNTDCEPYGWLWSKPLHFSGVERIRLSKRHFAHVAYLIEAVRAARASGVQPRVCECDICATRSEVLEHTKRGTDVALVQGVGPSQVKMLSRVGICTIHDLAEADPAVLEKRIRSFGRSTFSAKTVVAWQHHCQALRDGVPVRLSNERFEHENFIALDLEFNPVVPGDVWLIGALVRRGGKDEVFQILCDGKSDLRRGLTNLVTLLREHHDLPIVTWNGLGADLPNLKAASNAQRIKVMHLVEPKHVDLYLLTKRSLRLPIPKIDLKSVEAYLRVERKSQIASGYEAVTRFKSYLASDDEDGRERLREDLLTYNREDLDALRAVVDFLRTT